MRGNTDKNIMGLMFIVILFPFLDLMTLFSDKSIAFLKLLSAGILSLILSNISTKKIKQ